MLKLTSQIKFETQVGAFYIKNINEVEVDSSWENLTDTCKIKIPKQLSWKGKSISQILRRGDKVTVELGYDDVNKEVFRGFIREVSVQIPIELICEDAMFLLKKKNFNKSFQSVNTESIINYVVGNTVPYQVVANAGLGDFKIKNSSAAKVLEFLRSHYFIKSWFRTGILYVGLAYYAKLQKKSIFDFNENIIDHDLQFRLKEDVEIGLKGIIMNRENKKVEVPVGDEDGEQRTFHYYNRTISEVKKSLEQELERLKYTGYYGSFTTFGAPQVNHGDIVILKDKQYKEREGKYLVKKVVTTFGFSGFRQKIQLESQTA